MRAQKSPTCAVLGGVLGPFASKVGAFSATFVFRFTAGQPPLRGKLPIAKE